MRGCTDATGRAKKRVHKEKQELNPGGSRGKAGNELKRFGGNAFLRGGSVWWQKRGGEQEQGTEEPPKQTGK